MIISSTKTIALVGNVWDHEHGESLKTVVIANGKITRILEGRSDIPGVTVIELDEDTVIFPGLINLHTHTTYNILPIWESKEIWKNRFQWRNNEGYKQDINGLLDYIKVNWKDDPTNTAYAIISEIQAVAGGTTLIQETLNLDNEVPDDRSFIIRNTGDQRDLQIPGSKDIYSVVDFYEPDIVPNGTPDQDTGAWTPVAQPPYDDFIKSVNNKNAPYYATLVHVGEGKSGFVKGSSRDPYSKKEIDLLFASLQKNIADAQSLKNANLSLTHGCGIDFSDDRILEFMSANNISLIWSPVSNLLLYLDTIDIQKLLDKNINICLGSDWSPSGSKHVLDELKFAKFVGELLDLTISPADLFKMVTTNPVKALGITGTGSIRENYDADLFVLRKKNKNALDALFESSDADIDFVMVNGRIVFGLTSYFETQLKVDFQAFAPQEGRNVSQRGVSINSNIPFRLSDSLHTIDSLLRQYCTTVINKPHLERTRFLASDDVKYRDHIHALKQQLAGLYDSGAGIP